MSSCSFGESCGLESISISIFRGIFLFSLTMIYAELAVLAILLLLHRLFRLQLACSEFDAGGLKMLMTGHPKSGQQPAEEKRDMPDRLLYTLLHILINEACRIMLNDYTVPFPWLNVDAKAGERIISIRKYFDEEFRVMDIHYFYGFVTDLGHVGVGRSETSFARSSDYLILWWLS